jgi:hypothetical protein
MCRVYGCVPVRGDHRVGRGSADQVVRLLPELSEIRSFWSRLAPIEPKAIDRAVVSEHLSDHAHLQQ